MYLLHLKYPSMIVAIGEILSSMLTVILKINYHHYYLLTFYLLLLLYCEVLSKDRRFKLQNELARSMCKK